MDAAMVPTYLFDMKTWFITGTSSGLGRALAEQALEAGDRVAATLRSPGALDELRTRHGQRLWVERLDVTDTDQVRRVVCKAFAELGRIDVIVSNAGYGLVGAAEELTDEQIADQLATNLIGSIQVIRAALPHLRAQGGGRVLQVSSEGGQIAYPGFSLYHATKWGIEGFVEAVAQEVAPFGVELTLVEPGATRTGFGGAAALAPALAAYDGTPAASVRRMVVERSWRVTGDAVRCAQQMLASVDLSPAPRRLVLGGSAYTSIRTALARRLGELDAQRDVALAVDVE